MSHESSNYVYFTKSLMFCWSRCPYPTCLTEVAKLKRRFPCFAFQVILHQSVSHLVFLLTPGFGTWLNPPPSAVLAWNWQIETEFSSMLPPFSKPNGEGRSNKTRFTSNKKQLKSLRGWWRVEKKHDSISDILSGIPCLCQLMFYHPPKTVSSNQQIIHPKQHLFNIMSFWDAHQAVTT